MEPVEVVPGHVQQGDPLAVSPGAGQDKKEDQQREYLPERSHKSVRFTLINGTIGFLF